MPTLAATLALASLLDSPAALGPVPPGALRVYFVRHGQAYSNLDPLPDLPPEKLDRLTALGREQSRRAARALRGKGVALIVTSPRGRARETAEQMRSVLGRVKVRQEPRLRPLEMGVSGTGKELEFDERMAEWRAGRDPAPQGGESLEMLGRRVLEAVASLRSGYAGKSVVFVGHSEVISNTIGVLEADSLSGRFDERILNGSITAFEAGGEPLPRLLFSNYVPPEPRPALGASDARAARPPPHPLQAP
jgi:broad specificity phosphatase PhoE